MFSRDQSGRLQGSQQSRPFGTVQMEQPLPLPTPLQRKLEDVYNDKIDLLPEENASPKIESVELVASFSWTENNDCILVPGKLAVTRARLLARDFCHIRAFLPVCGLSRKVHSHKQADFVPGQPPKLQPPSLPQSFPEDSGVYFRDINSARHPSFPIEPAVRAILHHNAKPALLDSDLFVCGNSLGCLLSAARNEERTFRFGVERIGSTTFFVRKTNVPGESINNVRGYGHNFAKTYTVWEPAMRGSISHQRIIKYKFMGLKVILRSECDGYLPDELSANEYDPQSAIIKDELEDPDLQANVLNIYLDVTNYKAVEAKTLKIVTAGRTISQSAIFDLKTRSLYYKDQLSNNLEEFYPRLWAKQIPILVLAFHRRGLFDKNNIYIEDLDVEVQDWEKRNCDILRLLGALLKKLVETSKTEASARFEVRRIGNGPLELWSENPGWSALPDDLKVELEGIQNLSNSKDGDGGIDNEEKGIMDGNQDSADDREDEGDDAACLKFWRVGRRRTQLTAAPSGYEQAFGVRDTGTEPDRLLRYE